MTDPTAGAAGPTETPYDPLAEAGAKLGEIAAEKSLPDDVVALFSDVLANAHADRRALNAWIETIADFGERLDAVNATTLGLAEDASIRAVVAAPAGVATAPLVAALGRISEARAAGSIPGVVASILEDLLAALGAQPNGPASAEIGVAPMAPSEQNPGGTPVAGAPGGN